MRRQSKKRAIAVRVYLKRRVAFLTDNPWCARCGGAAEQIHHRAGRVGAALLDESRWLPVCGLCHTRITEHPRESVEQGWSLPRIGGAA